MARGIFDLQGNKTDEMLQFIAEDFLRKEGFVLEHLKAGDVWRKGGALMSPQFISIAIQNGHIHIEAWVRYALLPGIYVGEMGLEGFVACAVKAPLKQRVLELVQLLSQDIQMAAMPQTPLASGSAASEVAATEVPQGTLVNAYVAVHNPTKQANLALIMGLVSIIAWIVPLAGIITTIMAIVNGNTGVKSTLKGRAQAGRILGWIFLVWTILIWVLNIVGTALMLAA